MSCAYIVYHEPFCFYFIHACTHITIYIYYTDNQTDVLKLIAISSFVIEYIYKLSIVSSFLPTTLFGKQMIVCSKGQSLPFCSYIVVKS